MITIIELPYPEKLTQSCSMEKEFFGKIFEFGEGYLQTKDHYEETAWKMEWGGLTLAEYNALVTAIEGLEGGSFVLWQPFYELLPKLWYVEATRTGTKHKTYHEYSCTLKSVVSEITAGELIYPTITVVQTLAPCSNYLVIVDFGIEITGVVLTDFVTTNGVLSDLTTSDNIVYEMTLTPTPVSTTSYGNYVTFAVVILSGNGIANTISNFYTVYNCTPTYYTTPTYPYYYLEGMDGTYDLEGLFTYLIGDFMDGEFALVSGELRSLVLDHTIDPEGMDGTFAIVSGLLETILIEYSMLDEGMDGTFSLISGLLETIVIKYENYPTEGMDGTFNLVSGTLVTV